MGEINLYDLFLVLKKRFKLVVGLPIVLILVAGLISFYVIEPEYESSAILMVGETKLANTYVSLLEGKDIYDEVINNLDIDRGSAGGLNKNIDVSLIKDPEIIRIKVTDVDPERATDIVNEMVSIFMREAKEFLQGKVQIVDGVKIEEEPTEPKLINKAQVPKKPISPNPTLNMAISGILGVMIASLAVFILEFSDRTLKSINGIEKDLGIPILGSITDVEDNDSELISVNDNNSSEMIESYRNLRTSIDYYNSKGKLKTIAITSTISNEGKSIVASNLAMTIAEENKKVLLVDCDLRKPKIHDTLGLDNYIGLTDVLEGNKSVDEVVQTYKKNKNLKVLTSGPINTNPIKLLNSEEMVNFVNEIENQFDMVILYTPPIGIITDSIIVSSIVDGVIFVVSVGRADRDEIIRGKDLLDKGKVNIIGVVANKIPSKDKKYKNRYNEYYN